MKHIPRKRFGQHFLADAAVIDAIVRGIAPQPGQVMVEIGPGLAALTQPLVERLGHLTVIELDRDLAARLRHQKNLTVVESDVLNVVFSDKPDHESAINIDSNSDKKQSKTEVIFVPPEKLRIVGNLPYNISSPILFHLLPFAHLVRDQHFMLQKEVVDRMVAAPASGDYGRLSVMLQWRYAMENILFVPPEAFDPPPRVDSAVVRMEPRQGADLALLEPTLLEALVKTAFSQRRKLLRHALGPWLQQHGFTGHFDLQRRAEEVPVAEYVALAQALATTPA
ncbi:MAG: rRNA ((1518)-N(6)/adenine(1519)-N(6))-dimethyltransferase RsmA [Pseudomonadota bacterium]